MVAVSTFRPHAQSEDYALNQIRAIRSWQPFFDTVILLGKPEPSLAFNNVIFVESDGAFPTIKQMIMFLTQSNGWGCWINADIVLGPAFSRVLDAMERHRCRASTSRRWTFDPKTFDLSRAFLKKNDWGLDIFLAKDAEWKSMYPLIHPGLRKAGMVYDTWMTGYFFKTMGNTYRSFTDFRCVFHPEHEGRQRGFQNEMKWIQDKYGNAARIPLSLSTAL